MALFITILYILLIDTLVKLNLCETIYLFFRNFKVAHYTVRIKKKHGSFSTVAVQHIYPKADVYL